MDTKLIFILVGVLFVLCYCKKKQSKFSKLEQKQPLINNVKQDPLNVYHLDTRYEYPNTPPVNPIAYKSLLVSSIPVENDLYSTQDYSTEGYLLQQNDVSDSTNQLNYSGGSTQIIKIPLQMNEPYNEQLRSQEIMITPYNRIKYNITGDQSCTMV